MSRQSVTVLKAPREFGSEIPAGIVPSSLLHVYEKLLDLGIPHIKSESCAEFKQWKIRNPAHAKRVLAGEAVLLNKRAREKLSLTAERNYWRLDL